MSRHSAGDGADETQPAPHAYDYEGAPDPITGERPVDSARTSAADDGSGGDAARPAGAASDDGAADDALLPSTSWYDSASSFAPIPGTESPPPVDDGAERYGQIPRSFDPAHPDPIDMDADPTRGSSGRSDRWGAAPAPSSAVDPTAATGSGPAHGSHDGSASSASTGTSGLPASRASASYGTAGTASDDEPVCPRHLDRVAYVRCQRCHRPACPECQRPAAVGVLCVDCAREMERQQRQTAPRTTMGGRASASQPVVTYTVMALCIVLFLGEMVARGPIDQLLMFAPFRALAMPWTFITSGFLHASITHIAFNMYALWVVGQYLERAMGRGRFLGVYLVSIIAGHTAVLLLTDPSSTSWISGTVGASGGIFGLFGSMFVLNRRMGAESGQVLVLIAINLAITFIVPGISWQGHLGGLIVGTATTAALFATRPKASAGSDRAALARRSALIHAGVIAGALLLCAILVGIKVAAAPAGAFGTL